MRHSRLHGRARGGALPAWGPGAGIPGLRLGGSRRHGRGRPSSPRPAGASSAWRKRRAAARFLPGRRAGHTRWATHGAPTDVNAHPHVSCGGASPLSTTGSSKTTPHCARSSRPSAAPSAARRIRRSSPTCWSWAHGGDSREALMRTVARLECSYALGVVCTDSPGEVYAVREASPLILGLGAGENCLPRTSRPSCPIRRAPSGSRTGSSRACARRAQVLDFAGRPVSRRSPAWTGVRGRGKGGWEQLHAQGDYGAAARAVLGARAPARTGSWDSGAELAPAGAARPVADNGLRLRLLRGLRGGSSPSSASAASL